MTGKHSSPQDETEPLVDDVAEAMKQLGWRMPTDEDGVARAQREMAERIDRACPPAFDRIEAGPAACEPVPRLDPRADPDMLSLAARNGAELPAEILRRMHADRDRAESERADELDEQGDA